MITNSLFTASELAGWGHQVFLSGGQLDAEYKAFFDDHACTYLERFTPDLGFVSVGAIDPEYGLMDYHPGEVRTNRIIYKNAKCSILLADASKFGRQGLIRTTEAAVLGSLVASSPLPSMFQAMFSGVEVVIASNALAG